MELKMKKTSLEENVIHCIFVSFFCCNCSITTTRRAFSNSEDIFLDELDTVMAQCFVAFDDWNSSLRLQDSLHNSFSAINASSDFHPFLPVSNELIPPRMIREDSNRERFPEEGERPNSILSHFVLAPWLILMLVVSAAFTSSFTSKMTSSQIDPSKTDIEMLKRTNAIIGCDGNSFSFKYLEEVLGFKAKNIRSISSIDEYAVLLSSGKIAVAFVLMPYAKLFLAKYCTCFAIAGSTYELGGFGFAFPKGSTLASEMSKAIVRLRASGNLRLIEEEMLSSVNCSASPGGSNVRQSLGPEAFLGFFIISGCTSAIALLITLFRLLRQQWKRKNNIQEELMGRGLWLWLATLFTPN